jgi:uncharacterized protein with von Willebrand factor type A (vWA) domain
MEKSTDISPQEALLDDSERLRRWRLILGGGEAEGTQHALQKGDQAIDQALEALYDSDRRGGLGSSAPNVARWLGDIRRYFPASVVRIMQRDALERLNLHRMLLERETLEAVEADIHLVANIVSLAAIIPTETKETARSVVRGVVEELIRQLELPMQQAVSGSLNRLARTRRPRHNEIDWHRTIRRNLKHYQGQFKTIIPEELVGYARNRRSSLREIILCVDQSGSMASSVVYSSIFASVLASLPSLSTRLVLFDTAVVDMTEMLNDPVELLFGTQLGGGTDINRALAYCQEKIERPRDTILVLVSDLYEGGDRAMMMRRATELVDSGVQVIALLALSDEGAPSYDHTTASHFASLGIPTFACTPDNFPQLIANTLINN